MEAIRCTQPTCLCECFSPGKSFLRTCDTCKHGWVAHALEKLGIRTVCQVSMQVEIVQPNIVFDIASLILYGAQATPIRLKILLDRLFSVLQHDEVLQVLNGFGWSYEDYARGYILQDPSGRVFDKWIVTTREEEQVIIQQFLRFGETKSIAQEIILQDARDNRDKQNFHMSPKTESEIKKFIERSNVGMQSFMRGYDPRGVLAKAVAAFPTSPVVPRLLAPTIPKFPSPSRERGGMLLPVSPISTNPLAGSPLTRLQTMQPFDYRREREPPSPRASPSISEKSGSLDLRSPHNLSLGTTTPSSGSAVSPMASFTSSTPVKSESTEDRSAPSSVTSTPAKYEPTPMDGVLNFSLKDMKSLAHVPSPMVHCPPAIMPSEVIARIHSPRTPPTSASSISSHFAEQKTSMSSHYADQKIKHLRKSSNPMKRPWQPTPGYGGTLISPSGKKRVLCTACNKTFCDKGALKIHYSAVHLKEMHKCSVDGCNMMFSSRRSRNRHSANPNPKLHMPQSRRKLQDGGIMDIDMDKDDEESRDSPTPLPLPRSIPAHIPPAMPGLITAPYPMSTPLLPSPPNEGKEANKPNPILPPMPPVMPLPTATAQNSAGEMIYYLDPAALAGIPPQLLPTPPKQQDSEDQPEIHEDSKLNPDPLVSQSRSSKRKRLNPTRCTQLEESFVLSDDEGAAQGHEAGRGGRARTPEHQSRKEGSEDDDEDDNSEEDGEVREVGSSSADDDDEDSSSSSTSPHKHLQSRQPNEQQPNGNMENYGDRTSENHKQNHADENGDHEKDMDVDEDDNEDDEDDEDENSINGMEIPIDQDNPNNCASCGKAFPNHFAVRSHYQNVHLKRMHICSVDGCNAAFPSRRSRDRHSSNLNLHRKLLSTSSTEAELNNRNLSLREEFLPQIYGSQAFQGQITPLISQYSEANNNNNSSGLSDEGIIPSINGKDMSLDGRQSEDDSGVDHHDGDSDDTELYNTDIRDSGPDPDPKGSVACHVCNQPFRDNLILKEHFEKNHPKEMFHCTIHGCDKIFSTRKSRNRHSQNDNLHRHLSPTLNGSL